MLENNADAVCNGHTQLDSKLPAFSACPHLHGSVGVHPFPGYVHGKSPVICPHGCKPDPNLGQNETPVQTLIREALEFQRLYHTEHNTPLKDAEARSMEILTSIEHEGTYTHTFDELQYGARVAWRNASKCANRKFWDVIQLLDMRHVKSTDEMFEACLDHIEKANSSGVTEAFITVFPPQHPLTRKGGARVWNSQLLRYAGHRLPDMSVLGDPSEVAFSECLQREHGWVPPGGPQRFQILPLVLQVSPEQQPSLYTVPRQYYGEVPLVHPKHSWFAALRLKWYSTPAVSNMEMSVGGIKYTGIPFNGWYADSEIVRNMTDEGRFNIMPEVADKLGYNLSDNASLWRDAALNVVNEAVLYSFRQACVGMVDHHTLLQGFWEWYWKEKRTRGYVPGNWKWIIPPIASHTSPCYLGLNKMTEYTLKPVYLYAPGWKHYRKRLLGPAAKQKKPRTGADNPIFNPYTLLFIIRMRRTVVSRKVKLLLLYASVSGTAKSFAFQAAEVLGEKLNVVVENMENFTPEAPHLQEASLVLVCTSTYGSGAPPPTATNFLRYLVSESVTEQGKLKQKPYAVFGIGSSSYPRFCAAADLVDSMLVGAGGQRLAPVQKGDSLGGRERTFKSWMLQVVQGMLDRKLAPAACLALLKKLNASDAGMNQKFEPKWSVTKLAGLKRVAKDGEFLAAPVCAVEQLLEADPQNAHRVTTLVKLDMTELSQRFAAVYEPGDHLGVMPDNLCQVSEETMAAFAAHVGVEDLDHAFDLEAEATDGDAHVKQPTKPFPLPQTYRSIFSGYLSLLDSPSMKHLAALAQYATDEQEEKMLRKMSADEVLYSTWCQSQFSRWVDMFDEFPSLSGSTPLAAVLELCPIMHPRHYSIASSSWSKSNQVHLLVGKLAYKLPDGSTQLGQCSNFLCTRKAGDEVRFHILKVAGFRLPLNARGPIVMVAAGTGLAPMRGFLQHRAALKLEGRVGPVALVFGCRKKSDLLCSEELQQAQQLGCLDHLLVGYSREPGHPKQYVQDTIKRNSKLLKELLVHNDSHIYVCGDSNMAHAVSASFAAVVGGAELSDMASKGRYHEDVFGVMISAKAAQQTRVNLASKKAELLELADLVRSCDTAGLEAALGKEGVEVDQEDQDGTKLLHVAAAHGAVEACKVLIAHQATVNAVNHWNLTPLATAVISNQHAVAQLLREHGGALCSKMHRSFYPVHAATITGDVRKLEEMLNKGSDPNQRDYYACTPLHGAAALGNQDAAELLIKAGAQPNMADRWGHTPMQAALSHQQLHLVPILKRAGAKLTVSNTDFGMVLPQLEGFQPTGGAGEDMASAQRNASLTADKIAIVQASWSWLANDSYPEELRQRLEDHGVQLFYNLFEIAPAALKLFRFNMSSDGKVVDDKVLRKHALQVMQMLGAVIKGLSDLGSLLPTITALAQRHVEYGVQLAHYELLGRALLGTLEQVLQHSWEKDEAMAWTAVMALLTHAAAAVYESAESAETELAEAGDVELSTGTNSVAAEKGHLIDTCATPAVNDAISKPIQDVTNKMRDVEFGSSHQ